MLCKAVSLNSSLLDPKVVKDTLPPNLFLYCNDFMVFLKTYFNFFLILCWSRLHYSLTLYIIHLFLIKHISPVQTHHSPSDLTKLIHLRLPRSTRQSTSHIILVLCNARYQCLHCLATQERQVSVLDINKIRHNNIQRNYKVMLQKERKTSECHIT